MAPRSNDLLPIGAVAARAGVAVSTVRYYEDEGLLVAVRGAGGVRLFSRSTHRRIAFIRAAQAVGLSLAEIRDALAGLPDGRTPTREDWARLSRGFRERIDERIRALEELRDELTGCIGCGCLSLRSCRLYNLEDALAGLGSGPRRLPAHLALRDRTSPVPGGRAVAAEERPPGPVPRRPAVRPRPR